MPNRLNCTFSFSRHSELSKSHPFELDCKCVGNKTHLP